MAQETSSVLGAFVNWWLAELRASLPEKSFWQGSRKPAPVLSRRPDGTYGVAGLLPGGAILEGDARTIAAALSAAPGPAGRAILRLPPTDILTLSVEIPEPAMRRAREILAFSREETTFDFQPSSKPEGGMRRVRQFIVKNKIAKSLIDELQAFGVGIARLDVEGAEGINLLPAELRQKQRSQFRWEYALLGAGLILALAAIHHRQGRIIDLLEAHRDRLHDETGAVREAAAQANAAAANTETFRNHVAANPLILSTLASLTGTLDDSVWLTELTISGRVVAMSGFAASASKVIADLEVSPAYKDAAFASTVFTDQATNVERFSAKALVETNAAPEPEGAK